MITPSGLTTPYNFGVGNTIPPCWNYSTSDLHSNSGSDNLCWSANSGGVVNQASGAVVDAAGNNVLSASLSQNNVVLLEYPGPNGTTPTYKLTFTPYAVNVDFGCGLTVPTAYSGSFLTSITYPDLSTASFTYELIRCTAVPSQVALPRSKVQRARRTPTHTREELMVSTAPTERHPALPRLLPTDNGK